MSHYVISSSHILRAVIKSCVYHGSPGAGRGGGWGGSGTPSLVDCLCGVVECAFELHVWLGRFCTTAQHYPEGPPEVGCAQADDIIECVAQRLLEQAMFGEVGSSSGPRVWLRHADKGVSCIPRAVAG